MDIDALDTDLDHPSWLTLAGTGLGYGLLLVAMFLALFVVPFVLFWQVL